MKTKRYIAILLLACMLILPIRASDKTYGALPPGGVSEVDQIFMGYSGTCPRMEVALDGRLMMVYEVGKQMRIVFSDDEGVTWSRYIVALDYTGTGYSPANCALFVDRQTKLIYLCFRAPINNPNGTYTANINYVVSSDNGETWSQPINVATATVTSNEEGGGMWEPTIYRTDGRIRIYYCSTEVKQGNGQVYINGGTSAERHDVDFPYVISRSVQNIVMHELDEETGVWSGAVCVQNGYSHVPYKIVDSLGYHCRDGMQSIAELPDGSYVMAIESSKYNLASRYGMTRYPMVVDISFSLDGVNFSKPRTIALPVAAKHVCGAPWVSVLPDGRVAVCYQSDNYVKDLSKEKYDSTRQVELVISNRPISYADRDVIGTEWFDRYLPLDRFNTDVTYNHWNGLFVYGNRIFVLSNHTTNDKSVTAALGMILSVYDTRPIWDIDGDGVLGDGDVAGLIEYLADLRECDANGDGRTSNADATYLIRYVAGF